MPTMIWVALPIALFAAYAAARAALGRAITARGLNILSSLLLLAYVLVTAGLGVFWVANQQLPVFDLHYLFGYVTILLVGIHLYFNFSAVTRYFRVRPRARDANRESAPGRPAAGAGRRTAEANRGRLIGAGAGFIAAVAIAFGLGMRHAKTEVRVEWGQAGSGAGERAAEGRGPIHLIERYHELSSHSRRGVIARAPSVDWDAPPPPFKSYEGAPRVALPAPEKSGPRGLSDALSGPAPASGPLDLRRLSTILYYTAGITQDRGGLALRASPSSGALFPSEIYVAARSVEGLSPGLYHYDPNTASLARLRDAAPSDVELGAAPGSVSGAPATIALTAVFRRTGHKYRDRAYRYAVADTGHALQNLLVAAFEMGLHAAPLRRFDEALAAKSLGIDGLEEGPLALVPLTNGPAPGPELREAPSSFHYPDAAEVSSAPLGVTGMVHLATSLRRRVMAEPDTPAPARFPIEGGLALPAPAAATGSSLAAIAARRSQRDFSDEPVALGELASILHFAAGGQARLSGAARVYAIANRVESLAKGAYRYEPSGPALIPSRPGDLRREAQSAALSQEVIGQAAVVFILAIDREVMATEGARGYRNAYLEVGLIGERIYLEATVRGLGACGVGAFYDDEAAALLGLDNDRAWVAHFVALGRI